MFEVEVEETMIWDRPSADGRGMDAITVKIVQVAKNGVIVELPDGTRKRAARDDLRWPKPKPMPKPMLTPFAPSTTPPPVPRPQFKGLTPRPPPRWAPPGTPLTDRGNVVSLARRKNEQFAQRVAALGPDRRTTLECVKNCHPDIPEEELLDILEGQMIW